MAIAIPVPHNLTKHERALSQLISEILRRSVDGSINPIQINVQINVTGNDFVVKTAGNGLVLPTRNGLHTYRILMENDGAISADQLT